jgi:hypothetical protein
MAGQDWLLTEDGQYKISPSISRYQLSANTKLHSVVIVWSC